MAFLKKFGKKVYGFEKNTIFVATWGEIPSHRCISFYFALYRKDLGNLFGIVRMRSKGKGHGWHSQPST